MAGNSKDDIDFSIPRPGTDVVLVVGKKEIHVNKEVVSSFSSYFRTLLQSPNFVESSQPRVEIEYDYQPLLLCIQIIHQTGPLPSGYMTLAKVEDLLTAADRFDIRAVRRFCEIELMASAKQTLMSSTKIGFYLLASRHKLEKAKEGILNEMKADHWFKWCSNNVPDNVAEQLLSVSELHAILKNVKKTS